MIAKHADNVCPLHFLRLYVVPNQHVMSIVYAVASIQGPLNVLSCVCIIKTYRFSKLLGGFVLGLQASIACQHPVFNFVGVLRKLI